MLRRTNNDYDPDDTLQTHETNSIICQIPINYEDYQNKRSSRASDNNSSRANLHQRNDLKLNVPSMTQDDLDNKSREYLETDTPMFSQNKSIDAQETQALRSIYSPDTSQDRQFKKMVEMAFDQIERLQELRDFLYEQTERLQKSKEEIAKNSRLAMSEFTDKYRAALKQLEIYFHNNLDKLKETEQEKSDFLTNKIGDNNKLISEIGSKINEMESKMKIDSVPYFIYLFETNYPQLEKFLKIPRFDEAEISEGWKTFNVPYLEFNLYTGPSKNVVSSIDSRSLLETQPKDLEPISLNKKPKHILSPQILMNTDNSVQFTKRFDAGKESLENPAFLLKRLEATELETNRSEREKEDLDPKKRFQSNPQALPRTNSHSRYNSVATPLNVMSRQNSRSPLSRVDDASDYSRKTRDELPPERSASRTPENRETSEERYYSKNNERKYPSRLKERNQYETVTTRSREYTSNNSVIREKEKDAKKKTYKDVIKKLEKESRKKEKLLEDMIESYKNLEQRYEREVLTKKKPDIYQEVLQTVSSIVKKHESQLIDKPTAYFYSKRALDVLQKDEKRWESEAILNKENNLHEYKKKTYKSLRDASKTPEYPSVQPTYEPSSPYTSTMRRNYSTNNFNSNTRRGNSLMVSKVFEDDTPLHLVESFGNQKSEEVRRRFRVYVPLGSTDSTNFFVVSAEKNDTVRDLMDTMLQHMGLDVEKSYKYYFGMKVDEDSPEKTILVASKIWSLLDVSHEVRVKSWPKFFLRTYDQKEHYDIKKLR